MSIHILKNDSLTLQFDDLGAELVSICDNETLTEYLWNADPAYWKRHAPILFPFVGSLKDKSYHFHGKTYPATQHGFARDMEFTVFKKMSEEIWFSLEANDKTKELYPFNFRLELGYRLVGRKITVYWRVINQGQSNMYFSIGGHPAFLCPLDPSDNQEEYYLSFDTTKPLHYLHINDSGLVKEKSMDQQNLLSTDQGILPIDTRMFDYDALIIEGHQCHKVSLLDPAKLPYLTVTFDAPLFGLWSPAKKNAPFICIEPWYGRCDAEDFEGPLEDRDWGNLLQAGVIFDASYTIEIA
ncbi:MAG TPA: aldose 1-epimerase family protein [Mobilitalea sp.]|nr:aldose 1-epimerase family protein [Mobilitalea sp.]